MAIPTNVEYVGGPLDGKRQTIEDSREEIHIYRCPRDGILDDVNSYDPQLLDGVYRRRPGFHIPGVLEVYDWQGWYA